jgi:hypothetical protein
MGYEDELRQSLSQLEACLETPRISGELPDWISAVQGAIAPVGDLLVRRMDDLHREEFAEIGEQDPDLLVRVENLKGEDRKIRKQLSNLSKHAVQLAKIAWRIEPDEGQLRQHVTQVTELGVSLVNRIRKQETAITTWLIEAFDRDRGTVD